MRSIRRCEIVSNLYSQEKKLFDLENMKNVLAARKCIQEFCYIIHDKDVYSVEEEQKNPTHKEGTLKPAHIHLALKFKQNQPQKLECVAKWFGVAPNFVNTIKGDWKDVCLYQIHRNTPEKFQYAPEEVISSFDYESFLKEVEKEKEEKNQLENILGRILKGEIREFNKTLEIDQMTLVMNAHLINEAFKVRSEHLEATQKERKMQCIFITGTSGAGKTTLARKIAEGRGLSYYVSSGSNDILDGYRQEDCLILDDIRPSSLGLSDLLKMLDPHLASSVKSRYHNKWLNCSLIILTSVLDIDSFYSNVFSEQKEPVTQLKRRCQTYIKMNRKEVRIALWDDALMQYVNPVIYKNDVLEDLIPKKEKTKQDVQDYVAEILPSLKLADGEREDSVFQLMKMHEPIDKPTESRKESISEEEFRRIFDGKESLG